MSITRILEEKVKYYPGSGGSADLFVHCSCGNDYEIFETFFKNGTAERASTCPECKEKSYLSYVFTREQIGETQRYEREHQIKIITDEVTEGDKK